MAEDMILKVKTTVALEIKIKIYNRNVPDLIRDFLNEPWMEVMKIIGLRDGCEGVAWDAAVKLADDLIWSVQPKIVVKERQRLLALIPELLQALQEGLMLIYYEQQDIDMFFEKLERIHLSSMRTEFYATSNAPMKSASVLKPAINCVQQNSTQIKNQALKDEILKDIVQQSSKHSVFQSDIADPELLRSKYFTIVQSMPLGKWVEFKHLDGSKRGKLAWKCDFTGEFTFLDRRFKVIADISMRDLIHQFELGKARIVKEVPFIDRAVDAVINGVKQYGGRENNLLRAAG